MRYNRSLVINGLSKMTGLATTACHCKLKIILIHSEILHLLTFHLNCI